jgi:hypothetical protein
MNRLQQFCSETYCGGEYAHIEDYEGVGDTLYVFLMRELADVTDKETAVLRLETAISDIEGVLKCL